MPAVKVGHLKKVCRSQTSTSSCHVKPTAGSRHRSGSVRHLHADEQTSPELHQGDPDELSSGEYVLDINSKTNQPNPIIVTVEIDGVKLPMELDTGASVSLISENTFRKYWEGRQLVNSSVVLRTYSQQVVEVIGKLSVVFNTMVKHRVWISWWWKVTAPVYLGVTGWPRYD